MGEKINTSKIVVTQSHELTDLVREIHKSKAERIVLTFTEQTDLLVSPINLKVLLESAQRENKLLIAQIIQNTTGVRNAKLAGLKVIETPSSPVDSDWEEALELTQKKKEKKVVKESPLPEVKEVEEEKEDVIVEKRDFEKRVESKLVEEEKKGYVDKRGIKPMTPFISIDRDLPKSEVIEKPKIVPISNVSSLNNKVKSNRGSFLNRVKDINKKILLKRSLFILLPVLLISVLGFVLYNQFATLVKVKIFVEAKPVEVELLLTGQEGLEKIDFENLTVPIKKEEVTQSLSDSIRATGKAYKGEEATGSVNVYFKYKNPACPEENPPKVVLSVGHILSLGDLVYKVTEPKEILCTAGSATVKVEAADIGEQYNVTAGKQFNINGYTVGYAEGEVWGQNSTAFAGGSKQEYTVLSQQDVDNAVEQLSTTAIEEVKSDLRESSKGWEIIENTILSAVDSKSIKTDIAVGGEGTTANLDLTIKGSATYFSTAGLSDALTELLQLKAEEDNLFETEKGMNLVLGDEIEKDITVEESEGNTVKIKIIAKSKIKPDIEKTELEKKLKGMKWEEGRDYINKLKYSERKSEITFTPMNYPEFLKRFPDRRGGVMIQIVELEVEE